MYEFSCGGSQTDRFILRLEQRRHPKKLVGSVNAITSIRGVPRAPTNSALAHRDLLAATKATATIAVVIMTADATAAPPLVPTVTLAAASPIIPPATATSHLAIAADAVAAPLVVMIAHRVVIVAHAHIA